MLTGLCPDQDNVLLSDGVPKTCYVDTDCGINSFGCIKGHCCPKGQVSTVAPGTSSSCFKSTVKLVELNFVHSSMFFYLFKLFSPWAIFSISFLFDSCFALLDLVLSAIHWGHYTPTAPSQCKLSPYTWLCLMMNQTHLVQIYHQEILDYSLSLSALLIQKHWVKIMKTSSALWWCFENMQFLRFTKFLLEKIQKNPLNSS